MIDIIIIAFLVAITISLGSGLFFLMRDSSSETRTVRALTWRIGLSLALIVFLIVAWLLGWLHPHGLHP